MLWWAYYIFSKIYVIYVKINPKISSCYNCTYITVRPSFILVDCFGSLPHGSFWLYFKCSLCSCNISFSCCNFRLNFPYVNVQVFQSNKVIVLLISDTTSWHLIVEKGAFSQLNQTLVCYTFRFSLLKFNYIMRICAIMNIYTKV